ncbi:ABC transporter permease [Schlesneria paludicola]|uniref:ABC transporter permease n=1 Tax=Schlesneria paludicola TaxID=360056 RepID=UPI00029B231A|nr:ABC transporter permease subunit [Schlesneria paludicola]
MFPGVLALLERSLRIDARAWEPHVARFGLAAAIYIAVITASQTSIFFGAPGLRFFRNIVYLDLFFITLLGITFFSTSITEEREEDTLGLMLMAGISPVGILLGKSGGRLFQAFLLLAIQYPFMLLAVTLGGITKSQISHTYVAILAYLVLLAGVGLFCSTISRRNRTASARLLVVVLLHWLLPVVCHEMLRRVPTLGTHTSATLGWIGQTCIFFEIGASITAATNETIWTPQVVTNLALGMTGFVASWLCFGLTARDPASEAQSRGLVARSLFRGKLFAPGAIWSNPIAWKDFYFVTGGRAAFLIRVAGYVLLYLLIDLATPTSNGIQSQGDSRFSTGLYLALLMFLTPIDAAWLISRSLADERRSQTLAPLMLLPISSGQILYSKIMGTLIGWLPGIGCLILGIFLLPDGTACVYEFFRHPAPPTLIVTHLILLPHLAALMAMFVRWGALAIGIGLTIGSLILTVCAFGTFGISQQSPVVFLTCGGILVLCGMCHIGIHLRTDALASR